MLIFCPLLHKAIFMKAMKIRCKRRYASVLLQFLCNGRLWIAAMKVQRLIQTDNTTPQLRKDGKAPIVMHEWHLSSQDPIFGRASKVSAQQHRVPGKASEQKSF